MPPSRAHGPQRYHVEETFRAPIGYAFRWCTDYSPRDPAIEKDDYVRRILARAPGRVVYQDFGRAGRGWFLNQQSVHLDPPTHWHAESVGTYRRWSIDYRLRKMTDGTTRFTFDGVRRATPLAETVPTRAEVRANLRELWDRFGRALEKDYRRSRRRR